jgi:hypothetical protein
MRRRSRESDYNVQHHRLRPYWVVSMDSNTYNDETVVQRTSPVGSGGLSAPHTNFGGGWLPRNHPYG